MPLTSMCSNGLKNGLFIFVFLSVLTGLSYAVDVSTCQQITSPGDYVMVNNLAGAPIDTEAPVIGTSCIILKAANVTFDCDGYNITNNGTSGTTRAILLFSAINYNITVKNCPHLSGYTYGLHDYAVDQVTIQNVTAHNNTAHGIYLYGVTNSKITNNTMYENDNGLLMDSDYYANISKNVAFNNSGFGFSIYGTSNSNLSNNTAYNQGGHGFYVYSTSIRNNVLDNDAYLNGGSGFTVRQSGLNLFEGNTAYNNTAQGFYVWLADDNNLTENFAYDNTQYGFYLYDSENNRLENNTARSLGTAVQQAGFYLSYYTQGNVLYNNTANNHAYYGIYIISASPNNNLTGNTVYDNAFNNILVNGVTGTIINDNVVHGGNYGIYLDTAQGGTIRNNTAWGHNFYGFYLWDRANNNVLYDNTAYGNQYGLYHRASNNTFVSNFHLFNNTIAELYVDSNSTPNYIDFNNVIFDNPQGNYVNFTNLSIEDDLAPYSTYRIKWVANSSPVPAGNYSFAQTFVDITRIAGTVDLDEVVWYYPESIVKNGGYEEALFEVWKYSASTWSYVSGTLDFIQNTYTVLGLNPASEYGLFQNGGSPPGPVNGSAVSLYGLEITNTTEHGRFSSGSAGNVSTEGGNISGTTVNTTALTDRWAAFYGNISGGIVLRGAGSNLVYSWDWTPANGGIVCASTNSSLSTFEITGASGADIDNAWIFQPTLADSGSNTFNGTNCSLNFSSAQIFGADYADTGPAGEFITCAYKTNVTSPSKNEMMFCGGIETSGTFWNGQVGNFELIVPTNSSLGATETYYFYANLD